MVAIGTVVRRLSRDSLKGYLASRQVELDGIDWQRDQGSFAKRILAAIENLDRDTQARIVNDADRIGALADEAGQVAICCVAGDPATLDALSNGYERSLWVFLNEPATFQRAEEVRYTDERRRGKHWDGFLIDEDRDVRRDDASMEAFLEVKRVPSMANFLDGVRRAGSAAYRSSSVATGATSSCGAPSPSVQPR